MDKKLIKERLWAIAKPYPRLQGLLMREVGDGTQGGVWMKAILDSDLDTACFEDACYEYESLKRKLPDPLDDLIQDLIQDSKDRRAILHSKLEQHEKYHRPKAGHVFGYVKNIRAGSIAIAIGDAVKRKQISREDNQKMIDELFDYENGKIEKPEWFDSYESAAKNRSKPSPIHA